MTKLTKLYNKLFHSSLKKSTERQNKINVHFKNIKESEKIVIDGKTYFKVKLQFFDMLNAAQVINQIEKLISENEFFNKKIEVYKKREIYFKETLEQLKIFNRNIYLEHFNKLSEVNEEKVELENKNIELQRALEKIKREKKIPNKITEAPINKADKDTRLIHLNEKISKLEKRIEILERELEQSENLVQILTDKIFEKELKISELKGPN